MTALPRSPSLTVPAAHERALAVAQAVDGVQALSGVPLNQACELVDVRVPADQADQADWARRLAEIGFLPGERLRLIARGLPGGDPLAVRVGTSTFALRKAEAACVQVRVLAADLAGFR